MYRRPPGSTRTDPLFPYTPRVRSREGANALEGVDGILVPGGFGDRGFEGKVLAAKTAREAGVPYFGICYGMQAAVVDYARHVAGLEGANSTEKIGRAHV